MELKPCPFCGKPASFKVFTVMHTNSTIGDGYRIARSEPVGFIKVGHVNYQ